MNNLNTFTYLEDPDQPNDALWQKSFKIMQERGVIPQPIDPEDPFSVDYEPHWIISEALLQSGIYVPGMHGKTLGVRKPRNIIYLLCHPEANSRGSKIIQCCGEPNCVNPAHMYVVSNKLKAYDQLYSFITDEEWTLIRGEMLVLEVRKAMSEQLVHEAAKEGKSIQRATQAFEFFNGTKDQIFTRAVYRHAKNIPSMEGTETIVPVLEHLQLLTVYGEMSKPARMLVEQILSMEPPKNYEGNRVTDALHFVSDWCGEEGMKEALQCLSV